MCQEGPGASWQAAVRVEQPDGQRWPLPFRQAQFQGSRVGLQAALHHPVGHQPEAALADNGVALQAELVEPQARGRWLQGITAVDTVMKGE